MAIGPFGSPRITELEKKLKKDPASLIFVQLAEEHRRAGNHDEAIRICLEGLRKHPSYVSANMLLGRAYYETRRYKEARVELEKVIASAPENLMAHRLLGDIHWFDENWEGAEKCYRMVYLLNPSEIECSQRLRMIEGKLRERERAARLATTPPHPTIGAVEGEEPVPVPGEDVPLIDVRSYEGEEAPEVGQESPAAVPVQAEAGQIAPGLEEVVGAVAEEPPEEAVPAGFFAVGTEGGEEAAAETFATAAFPEPVVEAPPPAIPAVGDETVAFYRPVEEPIVREVPPVPEAVAKGISPEADLSATPTVEAAEERPPVEGPEEELATPTLAELYASQGYPGRAISVYQALLQRMPWREDYARRIEELEHPLAAAPAELTGAAKVAILQRWLDAVNENRMPVAPAE